MTQPGSQPGVARCWRCFAPTGEEPVCLLCGAEAASGPAAGRPTALAPAPTEEESSPPTADPEAPEPVASEPVASEPAVPEPDAPEPDAPEPVVPELGGLGAEDRSRPLRRRDLAVTVLDREPTLEAVDALWAEDHVIRARVRRRLAFAGSASAALVGITALVLALWPHPSPEATAVGPRPADSTGGTPADPQAVAEMAAFGHGVQAHAAGLAVTRCDENPRARELRCIFRRERTAATAAFRAIRGQPEGDDLLEARLVGATDVSRIILPDGEASTFRLAIGGGDARPLPWVAWYSVQHGLYVEVSTTDEDPADLRAFFAEQDR